MQMRLGRVCSSETGFILSESGDGGGRTVRAPAAAFVSYQRFPADQPRLRRFVPMAPDLAVEVVSTDSADDVADKIHDYLRYGVRLVWIVYQSTRTIHVHGQGTLHILTENDTLEGGDVLPGFCVPVREIFAP